MRRQLRNSRRRRRRGFTIIEAMVASAVLAVGVVSLTGVAANSVRLHQAGQNKATALRGLEAQVATVQSTAFAGLQALDGSTFDADASIVVSTTAQYGGQTYSVDTPATGSISVTAPTGIAAELLEVTVALTWQGMNGVNTMQRRVRRSRLGG